MPIVVVCRCGKRFAAKDHLIGQHVPCPACGKGIPIVAGGEVSPPGIYVTCACGRAFLAPESMRGQKSHCQGCGRVIQIPSFAGHDSRNAGTLQPAQRMTDPLQAAAPDAEPEAEIPWGTLKLIGIWGGGLLLFIIVVTSTMRVLRSVSEMVAANRPAAAPRVNWPPFTRLQKDPESPPKQSNPSDVPSASANSQATLETAPAAGGITIELDPANPSVPVTSQRANVTARSTTADSAAVTRLPDGVQDWYAQPGARLSGIRRVNATDPPMAHFSWMTGLLPFLGHGQLYQQFDFQKPLTQGTNLQLGRTIVPEFLNPLDDYQRWKGYPFDGIALTHFVGISGVEDARNVVAAKLPRSDPRAGVFGYDEIARPADITDGQSQTVMVAGAGALANPWVFGGGATIRGAREPLFYKSSGLGTKGLPSGGSIVVMADGSVRNVSADIDPQVFKAMCTIRGADSVDLNQAGTPFNLHELKTP